MGVASSAKKTRSRQPLFLKLAGLGMLFAALALPSGVECWFDGLPWSGRVETLALAVALPFLLLMGPGFLALRPVRIALVAVLAVKAALFLWAPVSGWWVRVYAGPEHFAQERWERTYDTRWLGEVSARLTRPWGLADDFPLEWLNRYNSQAERGRMRTVIQIDGYARLAPGQALALVAGGVEDGAVRAKGDDGIWRFVPLVPSLAAAARQDPGVSSQGWLHVRGWLMYQSVYRPKWSLMPVVIQKGRPPRPAFGQGVLWCSPSALYLPGQQLGVMELAGKAVQFALVLLFAVWGGWVLSRLMAAWVLDPVVLTLGLAGIGLPWALKAAGLSGYASLGWGLTLAGLGLMAWVRVREKRQISVGPHLDAVCLAVFAPGLALFFTCLWWPDFGRMQLFPLGDDWLAYQNQARQIFVQGDWLNLKCSPYLVHQPLYRYVAGLCHFLFGQSPVAARFVDLWAVAAMASILPVVGRRLGLSPAWAVLAAVLCLDHMLTERFVLYLGSGLMEYAGLLFIMLAVWRLRWEDGVPRGLLGGGLLALAAFLVRQDHLPMLLGLMLLALPPARGGLLKAWAALGKSLWAHPARLAGYCALVLCGAGLVALRNYAGGGAFALSSPENLSHLLIGSWHGAWLSLSRLLSASDDVLSPAGVTIWLGALAALAGAFFRFGPLRGYALNLGLVVLLIIAPYALVMVNAYTPRFSLHLLPFAALSLVMLAREVWDWRARAKARAASRDS